MDDGDFRYDIPAAQSIPEIVKLMKKTVPS